LGKSEAEISKWINGCSEFHLVKTIAKLESVLEGEIISIPNKRNSIKGKEEVNDPLALYVPSA
jgi:hypothetical protein